jgi:hypothetical protein
MMPAHEALRAGPAPRRLDKQCFLIEEVRMLGVFGTSRLGIPKEFTTTISDITQLHEVLGG